MNAELLVLRLIHIVGGTFWVGSGLFTTFFLLPALSGSGPATGAVMAGLQRRRLFTALPAVAVVTMLSGLRLMWIVSAGFSASWLSSATGGTYAASGAAAIVAFALSLLVARPAAVRSAALGATLAAAPDDVTRRDLEGRLEALRRRGALASTAAIALLVFAAAGMSVARYLG